LLTVEHESSIPRRIRHEAPSPGFYDERKEFIFDYVSKIFAAEQQEVADLEAGARAALENDDAHVYNRADYE
jgi:hypothetical protein